MAVVLAVGSLTSLIAQSAPVSYDLSEYRPQAGLIAQVEGEVLRVEWQGVGATWFEMRFAVVEGMPLIEQLATRQGDGAWRVMARELRPEFRVVSGLRRVTQQQTDPLQRLGTPLTAEVLDSIKWEAFWDAPLYVSDEPPRSHQTSIPAVEPFANHPGMPRSPEEIVRSTAAYAVDSCVVRTRGARLEILFPGVTAGIFAGYLQWDIYRGTNLLRQMLVARTDHPSAAFKYDAGWRGLPIQDSTRLVWRDLAARWQAYRLGGPVQQQPVVVLGNNRLIAAQLDGGSVAAFPPPHRFYWARESEQNLGYGWYRKDDADTFSFGIRQAELEEDPEYYHNFALYNARPGTWQRMPVFFRLDPGPGEDALRAALAFTRGDRFQPLPGFKVMGHHYHVGLVPRLKELGGFDQRINDIGSMRGIGVDIYSIIDGVRGPARRDTGAAYLAELAEYYEAARRQSDDGFLVMPSDENSTGGRRPILGGHYDILPARPLFWRPQRQPGQPLAEPHPEYGTVYNLGQPADLMEMARREGALIAMPHPRSKRSTGYPDAYRDSAFFQHPHFFALGYRWGMGIDASEVRLGEYRFLRLWNEVNNWMAAAGLPPKFALAISESRSDHGERGKPPYDDTYGMSPVNYLRLDSVPGVDDMSTITRCLREGTYFVTTGEILIPDYQVRGSGTERTVVAELEWTFPLDFVEVVWGDGRETGRDIVRADDLPAFGRKRFEIPFDTRGKKWMRFAAWDVAGNGALTQPIALEE